ncbi:MAG: TonB-dependent receptor, partial [Vicinamibacterales bacterium]|nr:TonB-dependent receptor [Vicinamibacterales bacterium]
DVVATSFENNTTELELLAAHRATSRLKGSFGGSFLTRQFSTAGEEALSPPVGQKGFSAFLYEEFAASPHASLQFGGRIEQAMFKPEVEEPERDFTNFSGSFGLLLRPNDATTVAFSFARAARNPALEELYFHGAHPGNAAIENGNPDLESEHALGFDASFRWRHARASGEVTFFVNHINDFIFRENSGEIEEDLPVTFFTQGDARLQGVESHADFRLGELVWVEGGLDYVQGTLTSTDQPLPRMPPLRGRAGVRIQKNAFQAGAEGSFTATQDRIYVVNDIGETETQGYNLFKLFGSYSFGSARVVNTITARLDNVTGERYVNHLNYLKDILIDNGYSELGRNFKVVYSVKF